MRNGLDKWLWFARVAKTRTLGIELRFRRQGSCQQDQDREAWQRPSRSAMLLRLQRIVGIGSCSACARPR